MAPCCSDLSGLKVVIRKRPVAPIEVGRKATDRNRQTLRSSLDQILPTAVSLKCDQVLTSRKGRQPFNADALRCTSNAPDYVAHIIGHQQRTSMVECDAYRATIRSTLRRQKAR